MLLIHSSLSSSDEAIPGIEPSGDDVTSVFPFIASCMGKAPRDIHHMGDEDAAGLPHNSSQPRRTPSCCDWPMSIESAMVCTAGLARVPARFDMSTACSWCTAISWEKAMSMAVGLFCSWLGVVEEARSP